MNSMQSIPRVERLETAGLLSLVVYDEQLERRAYTLLWPDEADALADELKSAAREVREA